MFSLRMRHEGEDVSHLTTFDFTKLSAVNTCPTWGIVRYGLHKVMNKGSRAMALEAGSACHEVFGALRLLDLYEFGRKVYDYDTREIARNRMLKLYGDERGEAMWYIMAEKEDFNARASKLSIYTIESSGFQDDVFDKRRTMDNLITAVLTYADQYEFGKNVPYINGDFIGVENPFDLVVTYDYHKLDGTTGTRHCRFTGRIDGVHCYRNDPNDPYVEENKTASRLGNAWSAAFEMSHQVTGYVVAASTIVRSGLRMARVRGLMIPQPRIISEGVETTTVFRNAEKIQEWASWFAHTAETYFRWIDEPALAPKYTHSCNRYFRPCSYIPLCAEPAEDRPELIEQMETEEWSPLAEKAGD